MTIITTTLKEKSNNRIGQKKHEPLYDARVMKRGPGFAIGVRDSMKRNKELSSSLSIPGPGAYNTTKSCFTKASAPAFSMAGRTTTSDCNAYSPGPGAYNVDGGSKHNRIGSHGSVARRGKVCESRTSFGSCNNMRSTPSFTFGARSHVQMDHTPGPGSYNVGVGTFKVGPSYSIASREHRFHGQKSSNPGPGAYNVPGASSVGRAAPSYTIAHKHWLWKKT